MAKNADSKPYAIVTGLEYMAGIQAARILAKRHKIPVIAVSNSKDHPFCLTNCCEKVVFADNNLISCLESIGKELSQKAVLFPGADADVLLVSRNRRQLSRWFHLCLPDPNVVEMLMDKLQFYQFAQQSGFRIPDTYFIYNRADLDEAAEKLSFPCVFKPHFRTAAWNKLSVFKAFKVNNVEQLVELYETYKSGSSCFILQNWIEGPDANLYSCNVYFDEGSEPLTTFVARKLRQWPPEMGQSALGEECRDDFVLSETVRLFQKVGFRGLGYLEIKRDQNTGEYFIVEPNICRPTGRSAIAEAGGVDLLYTMYCNALDWPLPVERVQQYRGVKWIDLRHDLLAAFYYWRKGELTVKQWWKSVRGPKTFAVFSWSDPRPFLADMIRFARLFLNSGERHKRNPDKALG